MNWKKVKLGDYLFFQEGPGVRNTQFRESGVKLLNVGNINGGKINLSATKIYISDEEAYGKYKHFLIDEGDLVIASSGIVVDNFHNKIAFIEREHLPLCLNTSTIRFKVIDENSVNLKFFSYYLQTSDFKGQLRKLVTGSAQLNFGPSHLKQILFHLPDLATQKHIAEVLDKADALRQQNRQLLAHYDELLQSTFIELFGDPVKNHKGWEVKKLGEVVENKNNLRIPVKDADRKEMQGEYPYYGATGVIDSVNDYKFDGEYLLIAEDGKNLLFRKKPNAFMAYGKFWVNNHAHIMKYNGKANLRFLEFCFNKIDLKPYVTGIDQFKLTRNTLDIIPIPIPPLPLQQHFAKIVEQIEAQKAQAQAALTESEALFEGLLAGYFNA